MKVLDFPATLSLELTAACNNRCPGCSNVYADQRPADWLSAAQWATWLNQFAPEAVQLRLTGGEPTLHPEFSEILAAATSYDAWVTIFTNGRWIAPDLLIRRFQATPHLGGLLVSLHGANPTTHELFSRVPGSFYQALNNIRKTLDAGLRVAISTVLTRQSISQIEMVVELAQTLGVAHVAFNRYLGQPLAEIEPDPQELFNGIGRIENLIQSGHAVTFGVGVPQCYLPNSSEGCMAGAAYATIDPWGNVRPCAHSPSVVGSLQTHSLHAVWHGDRMAAWRGNIPSECMQCTSYAKCHGGCRAMPEILAAGRDPLRCHPIHTAPILQTQVIKKLPGWARPLPAFRLRPEVFGYTVMGQGRAITVTPDAGQVLQACNGNNTFANLAQQFGPAGLNLLGELWEKGLLITA